MRKLLLLLSLTGVVLGRCPDPSLIHPCTCKDFGDHSNVSCSNISSDRDLQAVVDRTLDYPFYIFNLIDSSLPYFNASWLAAKNTMGLHLVNCRFVSLFHPIPKDPLPLMEIVTVTNSVVQRQVQWQDFRPFVQLKYLNLNGTKEVRELGKGFKENVPPELVVMRLLHTRISTLEGGVFDGKKNLRTIEIENSAIKVVKNSYFKDQKKSLYWLSLSYNPIESLPDDLFEGFEDLTRVYLRGVKLKTLQETLFTRSINLLKEVYVQSIPLVCDCRIKWIVNARIYHKFHGTCDSPSTLQGKELRHLTHEDFEACGPASNQARRNALPFEH